MLKIDPIWQPDCQQKVFRQLLTAMSLPGTVMSLPEEATVSLVAVLATLVNAQATWSDEDGLVAQRDRDRLQATLTDTTTAQFIVKDATPPPPAPFSPFLGDLTNPEKGATLILVGETLGQGNLTLHLRGPGIPATQSMALQGFHPDWFHHRQYWVKDFPLGVDLILLTQTELLALPRSTTVQFN